MVVLTEEFHGMSLKRKGADEPGFFNDSGADNRFSLSCRATKMRRLACRDDGDGDQAAVDAAAAAAAAATGPWREVDDDVAMGDGDPAAAESASPGSAGGGDGERAVVVFGDGADSGGGRGVDAPRLRADWICAMLREADSRTVRELLAGAALERGFSESGDLALAVVPWVAPAAATEEVSAEEEASDGEDGAAAMMDVEGDDVGQEGGRPWTWTEHGQAQAYAAAAAAGEGLAYRWPQHCWAAAPAPAVAQASPPVMWSW